MRLLLLSDLHFCKQEFYGIPYDTRKQWLIQNLKQAYQTDPYDALLFLGDYALDFWGWNEGGSYLHEKTSYTGRFVNEILPHLPGEKKYLIPGNHEQYSHESWEAITGCKRQYAIVTKQLLILMLDNFAGDLDPEYDSDGTYTGADVDFIQSEMAKHPHLPVILCAHYFDAKLESDAFKALLQTESRILCLFCGHQHINICEPLSAEYGNKLLFHTGNYAYAHAHPSNCPFGFREVILDDTALQTAYITPAMEITIDGITISAEAMRYPTVRIPIQK